MQERTELLRQERSRALKKSPFFLVLQHCVHNCPQHDEWRRLADTWFSACDDLNSTWIRFEQLFLKLTQCLEACDEASISSSVALQVASDFVQHGEYGLVWLRASLHDRATALYGLVSASDAAMNMYLSAPVAGHSEEYRAPSVAEMREAIEQAGDLNGCLMV